MPSGHTDKATINARRPLTPGMKALLAELPRRWDELSRAEQNQANALYERGLVVSVLRGGRRVIERAAPAPPEGSAPHG